MLEVHEANKACADAALVAGIAVPTGHTHITIALKQSIAGSSTPTLLLAYMAGDPSIWR